MVSNLTRLTSPTVVSHPSFQTDNISGRIAAVMPEVVITRPTLLVTLDAVVVLVALDADTVLQVGCGTRMDDDLPWVPRVCHACVSMLLNQQLLT